MKNLREARKEKGMRQADLAEAVHVSAQTISGYETGYAQPPTEILTKLADVLEVSTDFLLGRTTDIGTIEVNANLTIDEEALISLYRKLPSRERSRLVEFAKVLAE